MQGPGQEGSAAGMATAAGRARPWRAAAPGRGAAPWRAEARATLGLAWPIALTNLSQIALLLTDTLLLGRLGTEALAAATLGINLYWALLAPVFGLAQAAAPMLAQARGAARRTDGAPRRGWMRAMRRDARAGLWAVAILTLPVWAVLWHAEALLLALGQEPRLAALAGGYMRALMWGLPLFGTFLVLRGFLAAMERPGPALWVSLAGVVVNALLGWALILGGFGAPRLGVVGAGVASTLAELFMLAALLWLIGRDRQLRRFRLLGSLSRGPIHGSGPFGPSPIEPLWRPDPARLREAFRIGLPIAGQMWLEIGVFATAALVVGWIGAVAVAAHAIAVQLSTATFMVPLGIGQAATARVGLATGAGDAAGAARAGWVAVGLGAGFMVAMALVLVAGAGWLPWLFLGAEDPDAPAVATMGAVLLAIAGLFQLADGVQVVAAGALRGLKDTRVPMLVAGIGYWGLGLPLGLALGFPAGLGATGVWIGLAAGLALVAGLLLRRWRRMALAPPLDAPGAGRHEARPASP